MEWSSKREIESLYRGERESPHKEDGEKVLKYEYRRKHLWGMRKSKGKVKIRVKD